MLLQFLGHYFDLQAKNMSLLETVSLFSVNFPGMTRDDLFNTNASIVQTLAEACAK